MTAVGVEVETTGDLDSLRRRLGDSSNLNRALGRVLDETGRIAEHSAEMNAPTGATRRLHGAIGRDDAELQPSGFMQARVGVGEVRVLAGGRMGPLRDKESQYPFFVHVGTGIFGPLGRRIRPRFAQAMRFIGRNGLIYARSTAGQKPQPYIREAFEEVQPYIPQRLDKMVRDLLDGSDV